MSDTDAPQAGRRERKRQQQLDHLADTAWRLFESEGYDAVTMERIAEVADVAKGTLYNHFPVKEALLRHYFHRAFRDRQPDLQRALMAEAPGLPRLRAFFARSAAWMSAHQIYMLPYVRYRLAALKPPDDEDQRSGMERLFALLIDDGKAAGCFRDDVATDVLAVYLEFLYLAALLRWLTGAADSIEVEIDTLLKVFVDGLGVRS